MGANQASKISVARKKHGKNNYKSYKLLNKILTKNRTYGSQQRQLEYKERIAHYWIRVFWKDECKRKRRGRSHKTHGLPL